MSADCPASMRQVGTVDERFQSYTVEMVEGTGGRFWKPYDAVRDLLTDTAADHQQPLVLQHLAEADGRERREQVGSYALGRASGLSGCMHLTNGAYSGMLKVSDAPWSAFFCVVPVPVTSKRRHYVKPWELLDSVTMPGGDVLILRRRDEEFSMQLANFELMNSRQHDSEEQLAALGLAARGTLAGAHVLVGGLGMGYTLRAALDGLPADARVTVAELVPEVVGWNRDHMGHLAGEPLDDSRVSVAIGDVAALLRKSRATFDVVLIDIDNGPEGDSHDDNNWLYSSAGLAATKAALKPGGVLTVWSTYPSEEFTRRLRRAGFDVDVKHVRSRGKKGNRHIIWVAKA